MNISERIEILRKKMGISLTHLNSEIGAYRGKITEVRKGKASFDELEIKRLSEILFTTTDYLLGKTDDPSPVEQKEKLPDIWELNEEQLELIRLYDIAFPEFRAAALSLLKSAEVARKAQGDEAKEK